VGNVEFVLEDLTDDHGVPMPVMRTSRVAASWILLLACLMATTKRFSETTGPGHLVRPGGVVVFGTAEIADHVGGIFEATSPLAWPPIPSGD